MVLKLSLSLSFRNSHFTNSKLKVVCSVLDLEKKGTHSDLVDRILGFLVAPKNSGKVSEPVDRPRRCGGVMVGTWRQLDRNPEASSPTLVAELG